MYDLSIDQWKLAEPLIPTQPRKTVGADRGGTPIRFSMAPKMSFAPVLLVRPARAKSAPSSSTGADLTVKANNLLTIENPASPHIDADPNGNERDKLEAGAPERRNKVA